MAVLLAGAALVTLAACSSGSTSSTATTRSTTRPTTTPNVAPPEPVTVPALPAGVIDCGTLDALSGWPTTTVANPDGVAYVCLVDALAAGKPARLVVETAGTHDSGVKTRDGYEIPARRITIWTVTGPAALTVVEDRTADHGARTTRICTGLTGSGPTGPTPTGCRPS